MSAQTKYIHRARSCAISSLLANRRRSEWILSNSCSELEFGSFERSRGGRSHAWDGCPRGGLDPRRSIGVPDRSIKPSFGCAAAPVQEVARSADTTRERAASAAHAILPPTDDARPYLHGVVGSIAEGDEPNCSSAVRSQARLDRMNESLTDRPIPFLTAHDDDRLAFDRRYAHQVQPAMAQEPTLFPAGQPLVWTSERNQVLANGRPFRIKGLNWFGFETEVRRRLSVWGRFCPRTPPTCLLAHPITPTHRTIACTAFGTDWERP